MYEFTAFRFPRYISPLYGLLRIARIFMSHGSIYMAEIHATFPLRYEIIVFPLYCVRIFSLIFFTKFLQCLKQIKIDQMLTQLYELYRTMKI